MPSKRRPVRQEKLPATSLEDQERQLQEKRRSIQEEMQQCEDLIKRAPQIKREQDRLRREELVKTRSRQVPVAARRSALPDNRHHYQYNVQSTPGRGPRLRRERSQGRFTFFFLLAALLLVMVWAYTTLVPR